MDLTVSKHEMKDKTARFSMDSQTGFVRLFLDDCQEK